MIDLVTKMVIGQVLFTLGVTGMSTVQALMIADLSSLQYRGLIQALYAVPNVWWSFVAGDIAAGIGAYSEDGWRWGVS
jgi:MFS family permease